MKVKKERKVSRKSIKKILRVVVITVLVSVLGIAGFYATSVERSRKAIVRELKALQPRLNDLAWMTGNDIKNIPDDDNGLIRAIESQTGFPELDGKDIWVSENNGIYINLGYGLESEKARLTVLKRDWLWGHVFHWRITKEDFDLIYDSVLNVDRELLIPNLIEVSQRATPNEIVILKDLEMNIVFPIRSSAIIWWGNLMEFLGLREEGISLGKLRFD